MSLHDITPGPASTIVGEAPQATAIAHQLNATEDLELAALIEPAPNTEAIPIIAEPYYPPVAASTVVDREKEQQQ